MGDGYVNRSAHLRPVGAIRSVGELQRQGVLTRRQIDRGASLPLLKAQMLLIAWNECANRHATKINKQVMMPCIAPWLAFGNRSHINDFRAEDDLNGTCHRCAVKGPDKKNPGARIA